MPNARLSGTTPSRKKQHVEIILGRDVAFKHKTTGLEEWEFVNNALPELDLAEIDATTVFLHRRLSLPLMISCMTGGYSEAFRINRKLAEVCEETSIALGVGSQRQALESSTYHRSFSVVREAAPSIPIIGNIGAAEVASMTSASRVLRLAKLIGADAFAVHLNPLQEFLQPEGNTNFKGVLKGIAMLVRELPIPVIVKEIGGGISARVARRLTDAGVRYIDVAGAGGTSWAGVELLRSRERSHSREFWDWGIPTVTALRDVVALRSGRRGLRIIASGGIGSGTDAAKCLALGADMVAAARPMLRALHDGGKKGLKAVIERWSIELRGIMFLTGSRNLPALRHAPLVRYRGA